MGALSVFGLLGMACLGLFVWRPPLRPWAALGLAGAAAGASLAVSPQVTFPRFAMQAPVGVKPDKPIERQNPLAVGTKTATTASAAKAKGTEIASFGTGCFWCSEDDLRRTKGVLATAVGYQGGRTSNPTYKQVGQGDSGHVEVTKFEFDPKVVSYRTLVVRFFEIHDPTQGNRQGPDIGEQYRSVIFTYSPEQTKIAQEVLKKTQKKLDRKITTTIEAAPPFWRGEDYHQQYYQKKGYSRGV
jgi:peptide-methionine (S)-S-oxide reductase